MTILALVAASVLFLLVYAATQWLALTLREWVRYRRSEAYQALQAQEKTLYEQERLEEAEANRLRGGPTMIPPRWCRALAPVWGIMAGIATFVFLNAHLYPETSDLAYAMRGLFIWGSAIIAAKAVGHWTGNGI